MKRSEPFPELLIHRSLATRAEQSAFAILVTVYQSFLLQVLRRFRSSPVDVGDPSRCYQVAVTVVASEYGKTFIATAIQG